jgi:hypothetical protein
MIWNIQICVNIGFSRIDVVLQTKCTTCTGTFLVLQNFCACTDFQHNLIRFGTLIWSFCVMSVNTIYEVMLHMWSNTKTCTHTHTHTYTYIHISMNLKKKCIYTRDDISIINQWIWILVKCMGNFNSSKMYNGILVLYHVSKACKIWQDQEIQHFQTKHLWINYTKWLLDDNILIDLSSLTSYHMFNLV